MTKWMKCPRCEGHGKIEADDSLGGRLRTLREARGLSLRAVSSKVGGISNPGLHQIETGASSNPSIHKIKALAGFYGVSLDELTQ